MSNRGRSNKVVTRNIFSDLLRVFKVLLAGYITVFIVFGFLGEVIPFVDGYSFYVCRKSYIDYGYRAGDLLLLDSSSSKGDYDLVEDGKSNYVISPRQKEIRGNNIVCSFNLYNFIISIYNKIINSIKTSFMLL